MKFGPRSVRRGLGEKSDAPPLDDGPYALDEVNAKIAITIERCIDILKDEFSPWEARRLITRMRALKP